MKITTNRDHLNFQCTDCNSYADGIKIGNKLKTVCLFGKNKDAVGLAHNQIAGNKKVYITKFNSIPKIYINPSIVDKSDSYFYAEEGCMSYPNKKNKVKRYDWVVVRHLKQDWYIEEKFDGFLGTIHQHEIQHLNGIDIHHQPIGDNNE